MGKEIQPIHTKSLELVVGYTGVKADTTTLVEQVGKLYRREKKEVNIIFDSIGRITEEAKIFLQQGDFINLGKLMTKNQKLLEKLGVSSNILGDLIKAANLGEHMGLNSLGPEVEIV